MEWDSNPALSSMAAAPAFTAPHITTGVAAAAVAFEQAVAAAVVEVDEGVTDNERYTAFCERSACFCSRVSRFLMLLFVQQ